MSTLLALGIMGVIVGGVMATSQLVVSWVLVHETQVGHLVKEPTSKRLPPGRLAMAALPTPLPEVPRPLAE